MNKRLKSSFHGAILEIPGVIVDNFEKPEKKQARAFFLSHCHSDHIQGLYSLELQRYLETSDTYIYTTELNAAILNYETKRGNFMKYIRILDRGSQLITLPSRGDLPVEYVSVKLIPAGHCIGATMFLFKTTSNTILFTGDFRININDICKYKVFHENDEVIVIHTMYIDTTFLNSDYVDFPKRSESVDKLISEIKKWLTDENNGVALHTSAAYGYEYIFNQIYKLLGMKVFVGDRWNFYSCILNLVPGVSNNEKETRIHLCRKKNETTHNICVKHKYQRYLYVHLSAMKWTNFKTDFTEINWLSPTRLDVCFATHCSRNELLYFVNYLSPKKIVGFPNIWEVGKRMNVASNLDVDIGDSNKKLRLK